MKRKKWMGFLPLPGISEKAAVREIIRSMKKKTKEEKRLEWLSKMRDDNKIIVPLVFFWFFIAYAYKVITMYGLVSALDCELFILYCCMVPICAAYALNSKSRSEGYYRKMRDHVWATAGYRR